VHFFELDSIIVEHALFGTPARTKLNNNSQNVRRSGCSDARVPPNVVINEDAGNVFVHRNVANMVVNTDANLMSALQYGVGYLKVKHVIVCGHYECGGVRAAEANNDFKAPLELWLRNIRDVYAKNAAELDAIEDPDDRHRRLVDLNCIQQCVNVLKCGVVQARRKETWAEGEPYTAPLVHAMVFDPKTGDLKRLDIDFAKYENELSSVYGLHLIE
jgi:carbonic anhydrase